MLEAHSTFARWALLASFVAATAIACGSDTGDEAGNPAGDAGPSQIVAEGGAAADGASKPSDGGTTTHPTPGPDGSTTTPPPTDCGLALKGPKWQPSCQSWMNANCCAPQLACATDTACKTLVDCIGACKGQNTDACVQTCEQDSPAGQGLLNTMGACSKAAPADGGAAIPTKCSWP